MLFGHNQIRSPGTSTTASSVTVLSMQKVTGRLSQCDRAAQYARYANIFTMHKKARTLFFGWLTCASVLEGLFREYHSCQQHRAFSMQKSPSNHLSSDWYSPKMPVAQWQFSLVICMQRQVPFLISFQLDGNTCFFPSVAPFVGAEGTASVVPFVRPGSVLTPLRQMFTASIQLQ